MTASEGSPYINVQTGPSCGLHEAGQETSFEGVLTKVEPGVGSRVLFIYQKGKVANYHSEQVDEQFDKADVEECFAACPCHDPANTGKNLGRKACLALNKLKVQEV